MNFFLLFFCIIIFIVLLLFFSKFQIHISNVNIKFNNKKLKINEDFKIILKFKAFNKITYYKKIIKKNGLKKDRIEKMKKNIVKGKKKNISKFKNLNKYFKLEKIKLFIDYSTEDATLTAIGTGIISIIIATIIRHFAEDNKEIKWKLNPMYIDINYLKLNLDCNFSIKFVDVYKLIANKNSFL